MLRTHTCGELKKENVGGEVELSGWVHSRRDHGGVIFIDLRDRYGLTQIKFDPNKDSKTWQKADGLRNEWVVKVKGQVIARPEDMVNPKLETGEVEVEVSELDILNASKIPPFEINEEKKTKASESLRLKYRFLDLRKKRLQNILKTRNDLIRYVRNYFNERDFLEVQTPILANSSPEGARDYLVPSRLYPGKFYALPQAPQQFKQLLMVGGVDKYFQIAPCFRDEDPRADRHPGSFYQIDMEMSFVEQEDIWDTVEPLMIELSEKFGKKEIIKKPFPKIPYKECLIKYGIDKPDLRFDMEIEPVTDMVKDCGFSVFSEAVKNGGVVHALKADNSEGKFTRKIIDELTEAARAKGAKGLAYIIVKEEGLQSPIIKFLGDDLAQEIVKYLKAKAGDIVFFGADDLRTVCASLGEVRSRCGDILELKDPKKIAWVWVIDFPMYDYSEIEEGKIDFSHNPFSMPQGGMDDLENKDPLDILAFQYDLVANGLEISSGAIRNHDPKIMYKAFEIAGYTKEQVDEKFGHMINAFEYGAPPHGGFAPGLDRLLMILLGCDSIRDIYAFPKDGQAKDTMLGAPSDVSEKQLKELGLKIIKDE